MLALLWVLIEYFVDEDSDGLLDAGLLAFFGLLVAGPVVIAVTAARGGLRIAAAVYGLLAVAAAVYAFAALTGLVP